MISQNQQVLINLSNEELKTPPKMQDKSMAFVNKTLKYANQNPNVLPEYSDLTRYEKVYDGLPACFKTKNLITEPAENPMKSRQK